MTVSAWVAGLAALVLTTSSNALADASESPFDSHPDVAPGVAAAPALELYVTLGNKVDIGLADDGHRYIVPITGGYFRGDGIAGDVMPGGADWQVVREDGVKTITALYSIRTTDGQVIVVDNRGITYADADASYKRTVPRFHAPLGKHDWLNKRLFVGTITSIPSPRAVIIRVYTVD